MARIPNETRRGTHDVRGTHVEIIDGHADPENSGFLTPDRVIVNGTDIGQVAQNGVRIECGDSSAIATVTLTLIPRRIDIRSAEPTIHADDAFASAVYELLNREARVERPASLDADAFYRSLAVKIADIARAQAKRQTS